MENRNQGLTLLELIVAMAILAIGVTLVIPSMTDFVARNRISAQSNQFLAALQMARSEAVKRGETVAICARGPAAATCTVGNVGVGACACGNTTNWENGWLIFVDNDRNDTIDTTDELILVDQPLSGNSTMRPIGSNRTIVAFTGMGHTADFATFGLCPKDQNGDADDEKLISVSRRIVLNATGRSDVRPVTNETSATTACNISTS